MYQYNWATLVKASVAFFVYDDVKGLGWLYAAYNWHG